MKKTAKKQEKTTNITVSSKKENSTLELEKNKKVEKKSNKLNKKENPVIEKLETKLIVEEKKEEIKKVISSKFNLTGPIKGLDGSLNFSKNDLHVIEMVQMRAKLAQSEYKESALTVEKFALEIQNKLKAAREAQQKLQEVYNLKAAEVSALYNEISQTYGVDMGKISYDPNTGKIHKLS